MPRTINRGVLVKVGVLAALVCVGVLVASSGASASRHARGLTLAPEHIDIKQKASGEPFFKVEGDGTVRPGQPMRITNETDPQQIGPHSFSLVTKKSLPKTRDEVGACSRLKLGTICRAIARWHGLQFQPFGVERTHVDAGQPGWDTLGRVHHHRGDSWFTLQQGETNTRRVTAPVGKTLYFMCMVHPFMQGKVTVTAP